MSKAGLQLVYNYNTGNYHIRSEREVPSHEEMVRPTGRTHERRFGNFDLPASRLAISDFHDSQIGLLYRSPATHAQVNPVYCTNAASSICCGADRFEIPSPSTSSSARLHMHSMHR